MAAPTILVADAARQLCRILEKALSGAGYRVLTAHDGDEGLETVRGEVVELALIDLWLPRLDGFSLLEAVRGLPDPLASTPVILMSGARPTAEARERAKRLGAGSLLAGASLVPSASPGPSAAGRRSSSPPRRRGRPH